MEPLRRLVTCHGVVTAIRDNDGSRTLEIEVWAEDAAGERLAPSTATVEAADA